jgi:hypothetical protein
MAKERLGIFPVFFLVFQAGAVIVEFGTSDAHPQIGGK